MSNRTFPGLPRDLASHAARRMLPEQEKTSNPAKPRILTEIPDNDSLAIMLNGLGYEVEVQHFAGGEATCLISRDAGDSRHAIEVELSPGTSRIWLVAQDRRSRLAPGGRSAVGSTAGRERPHRPALLRLSRRRPVPAAVRQRGEQRHDAGPSGGLPGTPQQADPRYPPGLGRAGRPAPTPRKAGSQTT